MIRFDKKISYQIFPMTRYCFFFLIIISLLHYEWECLCVHITQLQTILFVWYQIFRFFPFFFFPFAQCFNIVHSTATFFSLIHQQCDPWVKLPSLWLVISSSLLPYAPPLCYDVIHAPHILVCSFSFGVHLPLATLFSGCLTLIQHGFPWLFMVLLVCLMFPLFL